MSTTQIDEKWWLVWQLVNRGGRGRDLRGVDLSGADLQGVDLGGADLRGADLRGTDLRGADLGGADLRGARIDATTRYDYQTVEQHLTISIKGQTALKFEWCYVPAGYFMMGSADDDPDAWDDEKPQHRVYLPAFYLGKYPITNEQYQLFVQATGHEKPDHWKNDRIPSGKDNHPVVFVGRSDALSFCEWAAHVSGLPIRLLTEAEWEKGARGEQGYRYPWGNRWQRGYSNTEEEGINDTTPVDRYPQGISPYGAHDMSGNVWEWTSSQYHPYPYQADDGREDLDVKNWHVLRGGAWWNESQAARAAFRSRPRYGWAYNGGFRVGWSAPFSPPL